MGKSLKLKGRTFGPLKVICRWGSQSGNMSWVYWCRWCGHVGKRLGGSLSRTPKCPRCKTEVSECRWKFLEPRPSSITRVMADSPLTAKTVRPLTSYSDWELCDLIDRVNTELGLRAERVMNGGT